MLVVGAVACHSPAFVAPGRASALAPPRAAAVRLESEMEYLKRRADEKGEEGGGWSIFKPKPEDAKPDPPWLAAAKARSENRRERTSKGPMAWWKGPDYKDEDAVGTPQPSKVPWYKRMGEPTAPAAEEGDASPPADAGASEAESAE